MKNVYALVLFGAVLLSGCNMKQREASEKISAELDKLYLDLSPAAEDNKLGVDYCLKRVQLYTDNLTLEDAAICKSVVDKLSSHIAFIKIAVIETEYRKDVAKIDKKPFPKNEAEPNGHNYAMQLADLKDSLKRASDIMRSR